MTITHDRTPEYENHTRCRSCNTKTEGPQDYINKKNGKLTRTCIHCRERVLRCLNKRNNPVKSKPSYRSKLTAYALLVKRLTPEDIEAVKREHPGHVDTIDYLIK